MRTDHLTIAQRLEAQARDIPHRLAILTPDREPLTYGRLFEQVCYTVEALNKVGIGRGDRVALVLPDSAETLVATLSCYCAITCIVLKSGLPAEEFEDVFTQTGVTSLVVQQGIDSQARTVAISKGIFVLELLPDQTKEAGVFRLVGERNKIAAKPGFAEPDDILRLNFTSGTTARPKIIPNTNRLSCLRSSTLIDKHLHTQNDRFLCLAPLSISSTVDNVLRALSVGASVVCPPGFDSTLFLHYLTKFNPTWCSATAATYQAILTYITSRGLNVDTHSLRFIRAGSMPLPVALKNELEQIFQVPVIQGYGSTEVGYIADNPLPPAPNKPGSVGTPELEVLIVDDMHNPVLTGTKGEILVRGETVFSGYLDEPEENQRVFVNGWFKTGDQGYLDTDGYLFLTGRLKELINRGGEKISPIEVENLLMSHHSVAEAAVFAVPDQRLGEEVGAAVILKQRDTNQITEKDLRAFLAARAASSKVPRYITFVDKLPRTEIGKVQRVGLAEKLGIRGEASNKTLVPYVAPRTELEKQLAAVWAQVLGQDDQSIGINDEFLALGGDSLTATKLVSRIRKQLNADLTLIDFFDASTIAEQAIVLQRLLG